MREKTFFFLFSGQLHKILAVRSLVWVMFGMISNLCPLFNLVVSDAVGDCWQGR